MKKQVDISNRYPDIKAASLCKKLAALHGLKPENVLVTQGATSALGFIGEILIREGVEAIVTSPTYPNYYNIIKKNRGTLVDIPMVMIMFLISRLSPMRSQTKPELFSSVTPITPQEPSARIPI